MLVDKKATEAARKRHARGVRHLNELFGFSLNKVSLVAHTGRALPDKASRRVWREWRDKTFPRRVKDRKRRKMQKQSRRKNRG